MPLLRGAVPSPRHRLAAATPHKSVGVTPPQFIVIPKKLSMWGNDRFGDCVSAEEAFAKACHNPEIFISEQEVIQWARQRGFLNGSDLTSVLDDMEKDGFVQDKSIYDDGGVTSVDWTNRAVLHSAIAHGPVKIGVAASQLEAVCNATPQFPVNGWVATGFSKDKAEDHCVSLCGFGTIAWLASQLNTPIPSHVDASEGAYAMFTWSSIGIIDVPSMLAITHEAWLRNPTTLIK
jgi:hypothetical protein